MSLQNKLKNSGSMQERLQLRANAKVNTNEHSVKTLAESLSCVTKMTAYQIRQLTLHENGEFITCSGSKEALDIINHIKSILRSRGFGCYALHNFIWIVPFIHESIHIPDFEWAKAILPDLKADLLGKAFPDQVQKESHAPKNMKKAASKALHSILGLVSVLGSVLTYHGTYRTLIKRLYNRIHLLNANKQLDSKVILKCVDECVATLTNNYIFLQSYAFIMGITKWKMYLKKNWKGLGRDFTNVDLLKGCFKAALTFDLSREFGLTFDGRCVL